MGNWAARVLIKYRSHQPCFAPETVWYDSVEALSDLSTYKSVIGFWCRAYLAALGHTTPLNFNATSSLSCVLIVHVLAFQSRPH